MAGIIWSTGKCNMMMQELTQDGFMHHRLMFSALNHHLFNHMVPLSVREAALKRIVTLEGQVKTV